MSTGRGEAKRTARRQQASIAQQRVKEQQRLSETESELERTKVAAQRGRGGRSLLIQTSPQGVLKQTLGGA